MRQKNVRGVSVSDKKEKRESMNSILFALFVVSFVFPLVYAHPQNPLEYSMLYGDNYDSTGEFVEIHFGGDNHINEKITRHTVDILTIGLNHDETIIDVKNPQLRMSNEHFRIVGDNGVLLYGHKLPEYVGAGFEYAYNVNVIVITDMGIERFSVVVQKIV